MDRLVADSPAFAKRLRHRYSFSARGRRAKADSEYSGARQITGPLLANTYIHKMKNHIPMKHSLKRLAEENKRMETAAAINAQAEINNPSTTDGRRSFLKKSLLGGITLTGLMGATVEDVVAQTTSNVSRRAAPSDLKITDMRY